MPTRPRSPSQFTVVPAGVKDTATLVPVCVTRRTGPHLPIASIVSVPSGRNTKLVRVDAPVGIVTKLKPDGSVSADAGAAATTTPIDASKTATRPEASQRLGPWSCLL